MPPGCHFKFSENHVAEGGLIVYVPGKPWDPAGVLDSVAVCRQDSFEVRKRTNTFSDIFAIVLHCRGIPGGLSKASNVSESVYTTFVPVASRCDPISKFTPPIVLLYSVNNWYS